LTQSVITNKEKSVERRCGSAR